MAGEALVGRRHEAAILSAAIAATFDGSGGLVLVTGEAGVGKTALVVEAAESARRRGALVLRAVCWDGAGAPGYWPWVQVVRSVERAVDAEEWSAARAATGEAIDRLLGEVSGTGDAGGSDYQAFRLYDAVTSLVAGAARTRPVVVIIDDLQWADPASLRLLEFLVRHTALDPVAVFGTCRDVEGEGAGPVLGSLRARATTVPLAGLDAESVAELVARTAGRQPGPDVAATIASRTGGNPFFVEQTAQLWRAGGSLSSIAPGVREVIERRLARLPSGAADLLTVASLWGMEFDAAVVAAAAGMGPEVAQQLFAHTVGSGLAGELPGGRLRFVHDLVRETLCDSLPAADKRRLHAAAVRSVATRPDLAERMLAAQLANHAYLAGPDLPSEMALVHVLAAARDASARLAAEEAALQYGRALTLVSAGAAADGADHAEIALALGAEQRRAGHLDQARHTFEELLTHARRRRDPELIARAALGLHALGYDMDTAAAVDLIDGAYAALAASAAAAEGPLAARLLAAASRARAHHIGADREHAEQLSARAVDLARGCGDDGSLGFCLLARHDAIWAPGTATERLALAEEIIQVARRGADRELELQGSLLRMVALLEQGDPRGLDEHASFVALAERARLPRFQYLALSRQGTMATLHGKFALARQLVDDALALGERLGEVDRLGVWCDQVWDLARLRGQYDEMAGIVDSLRAAGDQHVLVLEATVALDKGDPGLALRHLDDLQQLGQRWPRWAALLWLTFLAELAVASGDAELCSQASEALAPYVDQWAVLGGAVVVRGPMRYWSALVAAATHRWSDAIEGFTAAADSADRFGARPWAVQARLQLAEALLGRAEHDDVDAARALLADASAEAETLGMTTVAATSARLLTGLSATPERPDRAAPNQFAFDGVVWTLRFAGRETVLPDAKGLRDLHVLLASPCVDVPVAALLNPTGELLVQAANQLGADPVLDDAAKQAYRRRLEQLDEQLATALDSGQDAAAAELDRERETLLEQLAHAAGLGGRPRRLGDETERARKTVTARIKDTLRRLDHRHPELAKHLRATVSTGALCRYQPDNDLRWTL